MRLIDFSPRRARATGREGLTFAPVTEPFETGAVFQAACFRLEPGHRWPCTSPVPMLLAVTEGGGWVSGADGEPQAISAGEAAFWEAGEEHETWTNEGLTAIVIESEELRPYGPRPIS